MESRGRPGRAAAAGLASLPDHLLLRCLFPLTDEKRLRSVALVSKRLHRLCFAPEVLHTIDFEVAAGPTALPRTRSLLGFLSTHGRHVRCLLLHIDADPEDEATCSELRVLVTGCLAACGAAGSLQQLSVSPQTPVAATDWLPGLAGLEKLRLGQEHQPLCLPPGVSRLQSLTDADLWGSPVDLGRARLPLSLTKLSLADRETREMPQQVSLLTSLEWLELINTQYSASSLCALSAIPSLGRLVLASTAELPPVLSLLTRLDCLVAYVVEEPEQNELLLSALQSLQQLTCLVFSTSLPTLPPAIARMRGLRRLVFYSFADEPQPGLPAGPWLQTIRWLGMQFECLEAGLERLAEACQLEFLCALDLPEVGDPALWCAFWYWVPSHPSLRCMGIDIGDRDDPAEEPPRPCLALLDALLDLKCRRPALQLRRTPPRLAQGSFYHSVLTSEDIPAGAGGRIAPEFAFPPGY